MAKTKAAVVKTANKRSTKYTKLAAVCATELAAKKPALVLAEKRLAKAQKGHQELLAEVARLDMLDRSLKALNEGLEPPQNVKYVYTYPQWVWHSPGWHWGGTAYAYGTLTTGNQGTAGQYTLSATNADLGSLNGIANSSVADSATCNTFNMSSGLTGVVTTTAQAGQYTASPQAQAGEVVVDLSSGAGCDGFCEPACESCAAEASAGA